MTTGSGKSARFAMLAMAVVVYIFVLGWMATEDVDGDTIFTIGAGGLIAVALLYYLIRDQS